MAIPGGGGGSSPWWVVATTNIGVASHLNPQPAGLTYRIVQAATGQDAMAQVGQGAVSVTGPYATKADAQGQATSNQSSIAKSFQSGTIPNPLSGLAAIGDFFSRLGQANTWIRAGEVILGLILLAVGLAKITHAIPIATKIAEQVK